MASTSNVLAPLAFRKLMALEEVVSSSDVQADALKTFRSVAPAWAPAAGTTAFGGHVYAQAAWAASKTVAKGMFVHVWLVLP